MDDHTIINADLSGVKEEIKLFKESYTELKVQELKMYADELKADNKLSPEEYGSYIKKLNGFKK